jgi:hypothetical protein
MHEVVGVALAWLALGYIGARIFLREWIAMFGEHDEPWGFLLFVTATGPCGLIAALIVAGVGRFDGRLGRRFVRPLFRGFR